MDLTSFSIFFMVLTIMCLAIMKPLGIRLSREVYQNAFFNNSDGAGFCYMKNGQLAVAKGLMNFNAFWEAYKELETAAIAVHFRIKTSGMRNQINCHPLQVGNDLCFIHNGVLPIGGDEKFSDTYYFNEYILKPLYQKNPLFWKDNAMQWMLENAIGKHNKIVFVNDKGDFTILNEKEGLWENECWFSNYSHSYSLGRGWGWEGSEFCDTLQHDPKQWRGFSSEDDDPEVHEAVTKYYKQVDENKRRKRRSKRKYYLGEADKATQAFELGQRYAQLQRLDTHIIDERLDEIRKKICRN